MLGRNNKMKKTFEKAFRNWTEIACREWGYDTPLELYYQRVFSQLPAGLRTILGYGIDRGFIIQ